MYPELQHYSLSNLYLVIFTDMYPKNIDTKSHPYYILLELK